MFKKKSILVIVSSFAFLALFFPVDTSALGISPAPIVIENIKPDMKVDTSLYIMRAGESQGSEFDLTKSGNGSQYVNFGLDKIAFESGVNKVELPLAIDTKNADVGNYEVVISVKTSQNKNITNSGSSIILGLSSKIQFSVTDKSIEDWRVESVDLKYGEDVKGLDIDFIIKNAGNSTIAFDSVRINAINENDGDAVFYGEKKTGIDFVFDPFSQQQKKVNFEDFNVRRGLYWVDVELVRNGDVVFFKKLHLTVQPNDGVGGIVYRLTKVWYNIVNYIKSIYISL